MYKTTFLGFQEAKKLQKHRCTLFSERSYIFCSPTIFGPNIPGFHSCSQWFFNLGCSFLPIFQNDKTTTFQEIILNLVVMNKEQPSWVPKFTKNGFEKTKIPKDVFTMLLWDYQRKKSILYPENFRYGGFINCKKLVNYKKKAQSRIKSLNRTFGITLRFICLAQLSLKDPLPLQQQLFDPS